jgi:hypothetical protein
VTEKKRKSQNEAVYTRAELLAESQRFGVQPEVMAGALALAGKDEMTISETKGAIRRFLEKKF